MKKIGFVDYFISEWHANNYPNWIEETCKKLGYDYKVCYVWAEKSVSPYDNVSTDEYCKKFGVEKCATIEELCEKSDCILVLSPDNPENHLKYAEKVLPYKKPTYIDKTLAFDYETAKKMFDIAKENDNMFFSTSALRYADELANYNGAKKLIVTGSYGRDYQNYFVHPIEMVVKTIGVGAQKVFLRKQGSQYFLQISYNDDRECTVVLAQNMPYTVDMVDGNGEAKNTSISSPFFKNLMATILTFFENKKLPFETEQTLEIMKIINATIRACNGEDNKWIEL